MDVTPGQNILVEVTTPPTNEAARKTLTRLCRKDPAVAKHHRVQKRNRPSWQTWRRGGRFWHHQMRSKPAVQLAPGRQYALRATVDVIRDLESVGPFVTVTPK